MADAERVVQTKLSIKKKKCSTPDRNPAEITYVQHSFHHTYNTGLLNTGASFHHSYNTDQLNTGASFHHSYNTDLLNTGASFHHSNNLCPPKSI